MPLFFFFPIADAKDWDAQNEEEALFIRRIADFWQEGEYQIVKKQIEDFLKTYPDSSFAQSLSATLGDLYIREKNFKGALEQYSRITDAQIAENTFLNRMQCLLELQWFATLADECEHFLQKENLVPEAKLRTTYLLAIALYQQCINAPDDSEDLQRMAERARPHFQLLLNSELSREVAQAFAHLCCILKDFASASQVYLNLAEQTGYNREEMLFQAAILQSEYDKPLAMKTFEEVVRINGQRSHDALYNQLVLSYDIGQYEELLGKKKEILGKIPAERQSTAHLFFGRSHLQLRQYPEALQELLKYADQASSSEALRAALIDILETAYQLGDEDSVNIALGRLSKQFPDDPQIPKGMLAQALLLKKNSRLNEANEVIEALCTRFSASPEAEAARFEQIHIDFLVGNWIQCQAHSRAYLERFPKSAFSAHVWRYLATAGFHLSAESSDLSQKEEFARNLETFLAQEKSLDAIERSDWSFLLAKTNYELKRYEPAIKILQELAANEGFSQRGNAMLLLALSLRDGRNAVEEFCAKAEDALAAHADLLDEAATHIALFNGYLALKSIDLAANHLYLASQKADIELDNLRWLADYYFAKNAAVDLQRAFDATNRYLAQAKVNMRELTEETLFYESAVIRLANLQGRLGKTAEQLELLQCLKGQYAAHPAWTWQHESEADLLLGTHFSQAGQTESALELFDKILAKSPTVRTHVSAQASLQSAQIRMQRLSQKNLSPDDPDVLKILAQLKTLVLQKNLANEPIHLDAAIEYIDFQTGLEIPEKRDEKRLALLLKTKAQFEASDDLLSADYQNSRKSLPEKDCLVAAYLNFFDAEIHFCQSKLAQEARDRFQYALEAKTSFQAIASKPATDFLAARTKKQLEQLDGK